MMMRLLISGIACASIYPYSPSKLTLVGICGVMTIWTDIFYLLNWCKKKKHKNEKDNSDIDSDNTGSYSISSPSQTIRVRRKSWKRDLTINTNVGRGSFNNDMSDDDLIPVKLENNNNNNEQKENNIDDEINDYKQQISTIKRKRAGKKTRERLARKKQKLEELEKEKEQSNQEQYNQEYNSDTSSYTNNADANVDEDVNVDLDTEQSSDNVDLYIRDTTENDYQSQYSSDNDTNNSNISYDEDNNYNNYHDDDDDEYDPYEGQEYMFEQSPLDNESGYNKVKVYDENELPHTSKEYYEFLEDTAKKIGYKIKHNNNKGYLSDNDIEYVNDVTDKIIQHLDCDYENRRINDPDGYWENVYMSRLEKYILKHGNNIDNNVLYTDINYLIKELDEFKEIVSALRLLGKKLDGWWSRGLLSVNVWWMKQMLSKEVSQSVVKVADKEYKGVYYLNKKWLKVNENISSIKVGWGESLGELW
jgi:hypothetical protein